MPDTQLDITFQALADPTRRAILARLKTGAIASLSEIAEPFDMSLPGVMKHVGILESAGLIEREKIGRTVFCKLNASPMSEAITWLQDMEAFWASRLDALAEQLEGDLEQTRKSAKRKSNQRKLKAKPRATDAKPNSRN